MEAFFAASIEPHCYFWIGETGAIGHEQKKTVSRGAKPVMGRPRRKRPSDQDDEDDAARRDESSVAFHRLAITSPCSRAHKVPNTLTPSSTSICGALTVVGYSSVPHRVPLAMISSRSA